MEAPERSIRLRPAPKRNGRRWLVHLDEPAAAWYASCVAPVVPAVEAGLSVAAVANRVAGIRSEPPAILLEPWRVARDRFEGLMSELAAESAVVLIADVRACYPSIAPSAVHLSLDRLGCDRADIARVLDGLRRFEDLGVPGLPIGPEPSAVLANAVLSQLDGALQAAGHRHVRWVDDTVVFLRREHEAGGVLELMKQALSAVGLELAAEKTRVEFRPNDRRENLVWCPSPTNDAPHHAGG